MSLVSATSGNAVGRACLCTGQCRATGICPNSYQVGQAVWPTSYCACPCHLPAHWSIYSPQCWCRCNKDSRITFDEFKKFIEKNTMIHASLPDVIAVRDRVEKLESLCGKLEEAMTHHLDKMADLGAKREALRSEFRTFYVEHFKELEKKVKTLEEVAPARHPHKCPVCKGQGKDYIDPSRPMSGIEAAFGKKDANGMHYNVCLPCEGKGIVWG